MNLLMYVQDGIHIYHTEKMKLNKKIQMTKSLLNSIVSIKLMFSVVLNLETKQNWQL